MQSDNYKPGDYAILFGLEKTDDTRPLTLFNGRLEDAIKAAMSYDDKGFHGLRIVTAGEGILWMNAIRKMTKH